MSTALIDARGGTRGVGRRAAQDASAPQVPDFEHLLGTAAWSRLPAAVRSRFSADAHARATTVYAGNALVRASFAGRALAHLCRCIGTPVAPYVGAAVPMQVRVYRTEEGIAWERHYAFAHGDCVVKSTKQFADGALLEQLGGGLYMRLRLSEEDGALHFSSDGYFFRFARLAVRLPDWFLPGGTRVTHRDLGEGRFRFTLRTHHPWLGELYFQDGVFCEPEGS